MFDVAGCADLSTYNQRASQLFPRIVCIFAEYADFGSLNINDRCKVIMTW